MSRAAKGKMVEVMLDEYDFSGGVRGKYAEAYAAGTNLVRLDEDVAAAFPDAAAVNAALRALMDVARRTAPKTAAERQRKAG